MQVPDPPLHTKAHNHWSDCGVEVFLIGRRPFGTFVVLVPVAFSPQPSSEGILEFLIVSPILFVASKKFPFVPLGLIPFREARIEKLKHILWAGGLHADSNRNIETSEESIFDTGADPSR